MPKRPGNEDREFVGGDRERQRAIVSDGARNASATTDRRPATGANAPTQQRQRSNRGFASMDQSKQKEIASKGGRAAHAKGTAHEFDSGEAREAGRKGGLAVSRDREHMAAIGRRGGEARGAARGRTVAPTNTAGSQGTQSTEGATQNSRMPATEREVDVQGKGGVTANPQGAQGGNASVGGERRPNGLDESRETFGNH
jgi:general stress protein YciG